MILIRVCHQLLFFFFNQSLLKTGDKEKSQKEDLGRPGAVGREEVSLYLYGSDRRKERTLETR